jgi:hypothetical protein
MSHSVSLSYSHTHTHTHKIRICKFKQTHLFRQSDDLGQKVHFQLQNITTSSSRTLTLDGKDTPCHTQITLLNFTSPVIKYFLGVQLQTKTISICLQLLSLNMVLPAFP